jgi:N-acetylglucosamine-6-phosphate deacetylase
VTQIALVNAGEEVDVLTLSAPRILTGEADLSPGWVTIASGTVTACGRGPAPVGPTVHLSEGLIAPGLVDAQVNGAFGIDLADADDTGWEKVARGLLAGGVTAFAPTVITAPLGDLVSFLSSYTDRHERLRSLPRAARSLGVHVEGPFLSPRRRGAHRECCLRDPAPRDIDALLEAAGPGTLRYLTLAPERRGGPQAVSRLVEAGVQVSVGHSDATGEQTLRALDAGADLITHLYNAQSPLHHRTGGVVGTALADDRVTCGLIVDGHHVSSSAVRIAFRAAPGRIMLVTDAVAAFGMPPGRYVLGGQGFTVGPGRTPMRDDGAIAGGAGRLDEAIALTVRAGVDLREAVEAATRVPARALGVREAGLIAPGLVADLVWLAPEGDLPVRARATWRAGELVQGAQRVPPAVLSGPESGPGCPTGCGRGCVPDDSP